MFFFCFLPSYNNRELETNSKCVIDMKQNQTILKPISPEMSEKVFGFDHSYWSFDGYRIEPNGYFIPEKGSNYCDQKRIFNELGLDIINNAFAGYNASIFAYGQTGSG